MIKGDVPYKKIQFPAGEMHVRLTGDYNIPSVNVEWEFERHDELIELLLYGNALKEAGYKIRTLCIPYFPCARQDRVAVFGDAFALKVMCDLVNSLCAERVVVYDPHSDVLPALLNNISILHQEHIFAKYVLDLGYPSNTVLVSPDGGALKKIYKLAALVPCSSVVECSKRRNLNTGEITETLVHEEPTLLDGKNCVIVDDITDGGRTFIEIAKVIRSEHTPKKLVLMTTHGIFSQGISVLEEWFDEIYTHKGKVVSGNVQTKMEDRAV